MSKKRIYIFGSLVIIVLLVGLLSFRLYASTNEQEIEQTIEEFFTAFYKVTPDTIDLILPSTDGIDTNQGVADFEKYAEITFEGLYTQSFYETFLIGDRYLILVPQIARDNDLMITFKSVKLTAIESNDRDKYYDFTVEIEVKDVISDTEEILINKGQIRVKQDFFKYKLHAIKFFEDKLVRYLYAK